MGFQKREFPEIYSEGNLGKLYKDLIETVPFMWDPRNVLDQWQYDAFTMEPTKAVEQVRGLWAKGEEKPVHCSNIANANLGTIPHITVYIGVHPMLGTCHCIPFHGGRHGGKDKDAPGKMYDGFQFWCSNLTPEEQQHIVDMEHFNQPEGVAAFMKQASKAQVDDFKTNFRATWFMVWHSQLSMACA